MKNKIFPWLIRIDKQLLAILKKRGLFRKVLKAARRENRHGEDVKASTKPTNDQET
jgi:hypothetical protein